MTNLGIVLEFFAGEKGEVWKDCGLLLPIRVTVLKSLIPGPSSAKLCAICG